MPSNYYCFVNEQVKDAEERSATEAEETAASSEELLDSDRREKPPSSRDRTPRKGKSRDSTPRVDEESREEALVHATSTDELRRESASTDTQPLIAGEESGKKSKRGLFVDNGSLRLARRI